MLPPDDPLAMLQNQPMPKPDPTRRAAAILAAREKFSATTQAKPLEQRLLHVTGLSALKYGLEDFMKKQTLMRGTALAAVLALFTVGGLATFEWEGNSSARSGTGIHAGLPQVSGSTDLSTSLTTTAPAPSALNRLFVQSDSAEVGKKLNPAEEVNPAYAGAIEKQESDLRTTDSSPKDFNSENKPSYRQIDPVREFENSVSGNGSLAAVAETPKSNEEISTDYFSELQQRQTDRIASAQNSAKGNAPLMADGNISPSLRSLAESPLVDGDPLLEFEESIEQRNKVISSVPEFTTNRDGIINMDGVSVGSENRDKFAGRPDNPWSEVAQAPVSTFSADVDTASYSMVRRMLRQGQLPPRNAVRVEELVNYFDYDYATPSDKAQPFAPTVAVYPTPWNAATKLVHIGIKGYDLPAAARPHANLVLLIDVSGSMNTSDKLPLVKSAFRMLINSLQPDDTIAIVTYAGAESVALEPTKVSDKARILAAIDSLGAGGGTAGAAGLRTAYELAKRNFDKESVNRIILATDGDFNIGVADPSALAGMVAAERQSGVFLSVLGFGMGNYQDVTMQSLAQNGNGVAAYIDTLSEARKVLAEQVGSTLFTIAKDVKFQVEFNPAAVASYRLLGYETRALKREDFDNDKVDAGDIGAGHKVTAIYEITPVGAVNTQGQPGSELRYQSSEPVVENDGAAAPISPAPGEVAFLKMRYKLPDSDTSQLITRPITTSDEQPLDRAPADVRFAAAVTAFAELLRGASGMGNYGYNDVEQLAASARGEDRFGYRSEFLELVRLAGSLGRPAIPGAVAFPPPSE